jgi:cytochrome c oxidase subunit II
MTALVRTTPLVTGAIGVLALALILAPAAAAGNGGFAPVDPASPNAEGINETYLYVAVFTGIILVLVEGALLWFVFKYRRRRRARLEDGPQVHGNTRLEIGWTVVPVVIVAAIAAFVFYKLPGISDVPSATAAGGREDLTVVGARFYWQFEYPNGAVAVDRMRVPAGRNVRLEVTAPDWDVIHSWWIPRLGGKIDAIPGTVNETWFRAERPGVYDGQCAELCGIQHTEMTAQVEALPVAEYEAWVEARADGEGLGEETFAGACEKCHGLGGQGDIGPALAGNSLLGDAEAVEEVVREGRGQMPPVGQDWDDQQMSALIDYLQEEIRGGGS